MNRIYQTKQGDMFDSIAKKIYGDERKFPLILEVNPEQADTVIFPANVELVIPDSAAVNIGQEFFPPWRKKPKE